MGNVHQVMAARIVSLNAERGKKNWGEGSGLVYCAFLLWHLWR